MFQLFVTDLRDGTQVNVTTPKYWVAVRLSHLMQYHKHISVRIWNCKRARFV